MSIGKEKLKREIDNNMDELKKVANTEDGRKLIKLAINILDNNVDTEKVAANPGRFVPQGLKDLLGQAGKSEDGVSAIAKTLGMAGGLGTAALGGGMVGREMAQQSTPGKKHLERILEENPELQRQYEPEEIRRYFNSLKQHAPRLVKQDPAGAGQALKKFLSHEGFDINSLKTILDIENKKQQQERNLFKMSSADNYEDYMHELSKAAESYSVKRNDDEVQKEYNELKELLDV